MPTTRQALTQYASLPLAGALVTGPLVMGILAGPLAAVGVFVAVASGAVLGPAVAIVVAHLGVVALVPELGAVGLIAFEASMAPLMVAPHVGRLAGRDAGVAWLAAVAFGTILGVTVRTGAADWQVAAALLVSVAIALYAVHRFELVLLDLVPDGVPEGEQ